MRKLDSNAHSVFLLYYHLILVVKYRKKFWTIRFPIGQKKYLSILLRTITLLWKNGIMIRTMFTSCSVPIQNQNWVSSSMRIKAQAAAWSKKSIRKSGKNYGRKCSGARAFACWVLAVPRLRSSVGTLKHRERVKVNTVYRFRIYPNKPQRELFAWKVKTSKSWLGPHQTASEDWGRLPVERCNHHSGSRWTILCCFVIFLRGTGERNQESWIRDWSWFFHEGVICRFQWKSCGISSFFLKSPEEAGKGAA